jgi:hypothetical protein
MRDNLHRLFPEPEAAPSRFDEVWAIWPVKAGKAVARAKFDAIVKGGFRTNTLDKSSGSFIPMELTASADEIIAGAQAYVKSQIDKNTYRLKDEGRFIPHLATWLGRAGWEDLV